MKLTPEASYATSRSDTHILDLNKDCFLEVFKPLTLSDLCATADVCRCFRYNSRRHFASPVLKKDLVYYGRNMKKDETIWLRHYTICLTIDIEFSRKLLYISQFLRNFGEFIKLIIVMANYEQPLHNKYIWGLIKQYCSGGAVIKLKLYGCEITGETGSSLRPLFRHLQKLSITDCVFSTSLARALPLLAPELRELEFSNTDGLCDIIKMPTNVILHLSFPKLMRISFRKLLNLKNNDIVDFLDLNPQLKKIGQVTCPSIDGSYFMSISIRVPQIEELEIDRVSTMNDSDLQYIGQLNNPNTLRLYNDMDLNCEDNIYSLDQTFMPRILDKIHAANIPLQHLYVGTVLKLGRSKEPASFSTQFQN